MHKALLISIWIISSFNLFSQKVSYNDIIGKWRNKNSDFYFHDSTLFYGSFPNKGFDQKILERFTYRLRSTKTKTYLEFTKEDSSVKYYLLIEVLNPGEILIRGNKKMDSTILTNLTGFDSKHFWKLKRYHQPPPPPEYIGKPDNITYPIAEKDLIGIWKNDASDGDTTQLIFFDDHKVMVTYHYGKEVFQFELAKFGSEQVIIFRQTKDSNTIAVYTAYVRQFIIGEIDFQELQIRNSDGWKNGDYWKTEHYRRQISHPGDEFN